MLERLVERLREESPEPFEARICVDTAPLLERSYARLAGLGWIGKNACLINERQGSWFLLGEVLLSWILQTDVAAARPLRHLYAVHRCLPDAGDRAGWRRRIPARCPTLHLVLHDRKARRHRGRAAGTPRQPCLRLRHLPGRLPVEPQRSGDAEIQLFSRSLSPHRSRNWHR